MVIKLYISGISGNKEVKKKQQRVQMILDSKQISYEAIDITEPGKEKDKEFMQQNGKVRESLGKHPLPPQIFNDDDFCGDYEDFDMANEVDELEKFLHIETTDNSENSVKQNEEALSVKSQKSNNSVCDPYNYHSVKIKWCSVNGLQEQIIVSNESVEESNEPEETTKSEVNGESDTALPSQLPSETDLKTEALSESVPAPEQEEDVSTRQEEEIVEEKVEGENNQQEVETEEKENSEKQEGVEEETPKEEEAEKESPRAEEEKEDEETNEKEESESEEGHESGGESPHSEKSQDD